MPTVLVTGAAGFLGSHVVEQLLIAGYEVRGAARSKSATRLLTAYASFRERFAVEIVEDLGLCDLVEVFRGVDALIHVASLRPGDNPPDVVLKTAVSRIKRVLECASSAGVKKVVVASSIVSLANPDQLWAEGATYGDEDYSTLSFEGLMKPDVTMFEIYCASKSLSERALWRFAVDHPDLDITTVHSPLLIGPAGRGQALESPASGTNRQIYQLICGPRGRPLPEQGAMLPYFLNVVDCARAHVLALNTQPSRQPKRVILNSGCFTWKQAVEHLRRVRPRLSDRLPTIRGDEPAPRSCASIDSSSAVRLLGWAEYIGWQETLEQTVDDLLVREREMGLAM
ncbi:NAD-P-binding protein [Artomyces pyxidatus]|uniref:NAD-P-binding protein n=1 Tax=Artomyces pyxidatus TaxID=48021 RepID=A0ACB8T8X2_9AGAM|nr:NAD-P-binding protein [Artomyces pyxidatus]